MKPTEKILFVDDDQHLLEAVARRLRKQFEIETQLGPEAGLAAIERSPDYAVIFSDMRMPGMDGVQFLARAKELQPDSIRIMLTGYPDVQTAIDAVNHGNIFRFLTKPCAPEVLVGAIEGALEQRRLLRTRVELLETRLRNTQQLELIGRCTAGVYHDLKNILTIISVNADLALVRPQDMPPGIVKAFQQIHDAAGDAVKLTQQLVTLGKPRNQVTYARLELPGFLSNFTEMIRHVFPRSISMSAELPPEAPPIRADAGMLGQVLLNLALNARDAMPGGGSLRIQVEPRTLTGDTAQGEPPGRVGRFVCLRVSDSGCGMNTEIRTRLFEPFFTTKIDDHGTGLGLAVVAEIIQQHDGWLNVQSQVGQGSTFEVFLPVWQEPLAAEMNSQAA